MITNRLRAILTIDLDAIAENWRMLDALSATSVETGAVVKADAYGLGIAQVAPALLKAGARTFFVALAEEGVALRAVVGPEPRIFVFSGYMTGDAASFNVANLIPLLNNAKQVAQFIGEQNDSPYGLQIDTGMNRLGMEAGEITKLGHLNPQLVISHLACADEPQHPQNHAQLTTFKKINLFNAPTSIAATGGILLSTDYHMNLTRPGIGLYGGMPFADAKPVVNLSLPVIQTRIVEADESVGYGASWIAKRKSKIATVAAGYADGLIRAIGNRASLYAVDVPCPIVGPVSMDLITVDVTDIEDMPEALEILNTTQTVDVLADAAGTIGYEILTSLGGRFDRRYIGGQ